MLFFSLLFGALFLPAGIIFGAGAVFTYFFSLPLELFLLGVIMDALGMGPAEGFFITSFIILAVIREFLKERIDAGEITGMILTLVIYLLSLFPILIFFMGGVSNFFAPEFLMEFFLTFVMLSVLIWKLGFQNGNRSLH